MMIAQTNEVRWWRIPRVRFPPFADVLSWCRERQHADTMLLAARLRESGRPTDFLTPGVDKTVRKLFSGKIRQELRAKGWPGTLLTNGLGLIYVVDYTAETERQLLEAEPELFSWKHQHRPPLPEDICLLRKGYLYPCLVTVTHEHDGWLLTGSRVPPFKGLQNDTCEESFLFDGTLFCEDAFMTVRGRSPSSLRR